MLKSISELLLLTLALSVDTFVASLAYGGQKITIPPASFAAIQGVCSLFLLTSLLFGKALAPVLPQGLTAAISFWLLFSLGAFKCFDESIKAYIRKKNLTKKTIQLKAFGFHLLCIVYADPQMADKDGSRNLSVKEATALAAALSLDSVAAGFGAALSPLNLFATVFCAAAVNCLALWAGNWFGNLLAGRTKHLSFLSGLLLMALAVLKTRSF